MERSGFCWDSSSGFLLTSGLISFYMPKKQKMAPKELPEGLIRKGRFGAHSSPRRFFSAGGESLGPHGAAEASPRVATAENQGAAARNRKA